MPSNTYRFSTCIIVNENILFSHKINPNHSFPSPLLPAPTNFPLPDPLPVCFLCSKEPVSKIRQPHRKKQDTIKQVKSLPIEAGQDNPIRGKEPQ